jgi:hypothetical protein
MYINGFQIEKWNKKPSLQVGNPEATFWLIIIDSGGRILEGWWLGS